MFKVCNGSAYCDLYRTLGQSVTDIDRDIGFIKTLQFIKTELHVTSLFS